MKLAITDSKTCPSVAIEAHLKSIPDTILSGEAIGTDTYAGEFTRKEEFKLIEYFSNYDKLW